MLRRPIFKIAHDELNDFAALILSKAEFVLPEESIHVVEADPSDNKFIEAAVAGQADYIVSGDNHLLDLKEYKGISIITPRAFLEPLGE